MGSLAATRYTPPLCLRIPVAAIDPQMPVGYVGGVRLWRGIVQPQMSPAPLLSPFWQMAFNGGLVGVNSCCSAVHGVATPPPRIYSTAPSAPSAVPASCGRLGTPCHKTERTRGQAALERNLSRCANNPRRTQGTHRRLHLVARVLRNRMLSRRCDRDIHCKGTCLMTFSTLRQCCYFAFASVRRHSLLCQQVKQSRGARFDLGFLAVFDAGGEEASPRRPCAALLTAIGTARR